MEEERAHALEVAEEEAQATEAQAEAPRRRTLRSLSQEIGISLAAATLQFEILCA